MTVAERKTVTIRKPGYSSDTYVIRFLPFPRSRRPDISAERQRICGRCLGVGTIIDEECHGSGMVGCHKCLGTGRLLSFPVLVSTFTPRTDYRVINPTSLPDREVYRPKGWFRKEKLSGIMLVDRTGVDLGDIPYVHETVNATAERFCAMNTGDDESRLRRRTLSISFMPVTQTEYAYKRARGVLCVFGSDRDVYRKGRLPLHLRNLLLAILGSAVVLASAAYLISAYW